MMAAHNPKVAACTVRLEIGKDNSAVLTLACQAKAEFSAAEWQDFLLAAIAATKGKAV